VWVIVYNVAPTVGTHTRGSYTRSKRRVGKRRACALPTIFLSTRVHATRFLVLLAERAGNLLDFFGQFSPEIIIPLVECEVSLLPDGQIARTRHTQLPVVPFRRSGLVLIFGNRL